MLRALLQSRCGMGRAAGPASRTLSKGRNDEAQWNVDAQRDRGRSGRPAVRFRHGGHFRHHRLAQTGIPADRLHARLHGGQRADRHDYRLDRRRQAGGCHRAARHSVHARGHVFHFRDWLRPGVELVDVPGFPVYRRPGGGRRFGGVAALHRRDFAGEIPRAPGGDHAVQHRARHPAGLPVQLRHRQPESGRGRVPLDVRRDGRRRRRPSSFCFSARRRAPAGWWPRGAWTKPGPSCSVRHRHRQRGGGDPGHPGFARPAAPHAGRAALPGASTASRSCWRWRSRFSTSSPASTP